MGEKIESDSDGDLWAMEAVVNHRFNKKLQKWQFLVKWKDCSNAYNSWVDAYAFTGELSGRRDFLQYVNANLDKEQARAVRLGSAGARKPRKSGEEQLKISDLDPREEEKEVKEMNAQPDRADLEQIITSSKGEDLGLMAALCQKAGDDQSEEK